MREKAIYKIYPNVKSTVGNDAYDVNGNPVVLDEDKIKLEQDQLEKEFLENQYQRQRALEYPSIPDQLDEIYHNGINAWKAVIKKTKDKYPKG